MSTVTLSQTVKVDVSIFISGAEYTFHATYKNYLKTHVSKDVCLELNQRNGITTATPDITQYTYSCLVGDDVTWPLAFYKVINEKNI